MSAEAPVPHHLDLYRYWEAKQRDRRIPVRRHIDPPADIPRLLPHIALIEAVRSAYRWRHMGTRIVDDLGCKEVYVYAMGQEPWLNYVMSIKYTEASNPIIASNKLIEVCRERGMTTERLFGEKEILIN